MAPLLRDHVFPALRREARPLGRVTVFTGSAKGDSAVFAAKVAKLAGAFAAAGIGLVYGGGKVGLMGVLADSAIAAGGEVLGVMPQALVDGEIAHDGLTRLDVVPDMHVRKLRMAELGDAFVALPGGAGTLEELFEAWTWQQLGIHTKPVALYDIDGYWQPLLRALDTMTERGFLSEHFRSTLIVRDDPDDLLTALTEWTPPAAKWSRQTATVSPTPI
ncbi:MAG TPA: TIGR00730 family Rossman fold protein [Cellulomonas sp.]|uniref:LOG family protein n=1 Tax=Cellulomonas sp. TaxID=40001 RepID=UPI002E2EB3F5|nr:TIGR00730 family Rossman fold protein [Cellulomonas sp.]HEX5334068.1 TIGR00730 family Rossman fold protein [Cellulomonas sp.]